MQRKEQMENETKRNIEGKKERNKYKRVALVLCTEYIMEKKKCLCQCTIRPRTVLPHYGHA